MAGGNKAQNRVQCVSSGSPVSELHVQTPANSIAERFEEVASWFPDRLAVKNQTDELTWRELDKASNRVVHGILKRTESTQGPVALLIDDQVKLFTIIVGVLKAGKFYTPLDPSHPAERLGYILEDCRTTLIVATENNLSLARQLAGHRVQVVDVGEVGAGFSDESPALNIFPDALAYLVYTSGSTGRPKGVIHTHRTVLHRLHQIERLRCGPGDRITGVGAVGRDIFRPMINGASAFHWNVRREGLTGLAAWLMQQKITVYQSVPSVFRHFMDTLTGEEKFPALRLILLKGAPVYRKDVELYREHFSSNTLLVNELGTTETSGFCQYIVDKQTPVSSNIIPVGYGQREKQVLLLDDDGNPVGFNQVGEIAVKSCYLSPGYWRQPKLTKAKFLPDPGGRDERIYLTGDYGCMSSDGCLTLLGRKDDQVKIRGNRIELAEVEAALLHLDEVREVAVVARNDVHQELCLVAYVVPIREPAPSLTSLRQAVQERLPAYMVPAVFVMVDEIPHTPNGKVEGASLTRDHQIGD